MALLTPETRHNGRQRGAYNTWKKSLQEIADSCDYDPAIALMHMAHDPKTPLKYRYLCHKTIFDRMYPSRHIVAGDPQGAPIALNITWNDGEEPPTIDPDSIPDALVDDSKPSEDDGSPIV